MDDTATPFRLERLDLIMEPDPARPDEAGGVLNPGAARGPDGNLYLFPRIVAPGDYSRIGVARVRFDARGDPAGVERLGYALEPREPYERRPPVGGGCEDPRVSYVEPLKIYVMAYAALGPASSRVALAVSGDLRSWRRLGPVDFTPLPDRRYGVTFDDYPNKDGSLFPQAVTGPDGRPSLAMLHRPMYDEENRTRTVTDPRPGIWISYCALDDALRDVQRLTTMGGRHLLLDPRYPWEDLWIGGGPPPLRTRLGWLVIYHGVKKHSPRTPGERKPLVYSAGALVLDAHDRHRVLYRSPSAVLTPETREEMEGVVPDAVFPHRRQHAGRGTRRRLLRHGRLAHRRGAPAAPAGTTTRRALRR